MATTQAAIWRQEEHPIVASGRVLDILSIAGIFFYFYFYFTLRGMGLHAG
jgi:hypothetical protein